MPKKHLKFIEGFLAGLVLGIFVTLGLGVSRTNGDPLPLFAWALIPAIIGGILMTLDTGKEMTSTAVSKDWQPIENSFKLTTSNESMRTNLWRVAWLLIGIFGYAAYKWFVQS